MNLLRKCLLGMLLATGMVGSMAIDVPQAKSAETVPGVETGAYAKFHKFGWFEHYTDAIGHRNRLIHEGRNAYVAAHSGGGWDVWVE